MTRDDILFFAGWLLGCSIASIVCWDPNPRAWLFAITVGICWWAGSKRRKTE